MLLFIRKFSAIFSTQFLGALNDNVLRSALVIYFTYDLSVKQNINPTILTNLAIALFIIPFFLFSGLAGSLADRMDKSKLIQIIKVCEIAIVAFAGFAFFNENLWFLLLLLFLMGAQSSFFGPLKYGILPNLLKKKELLLGNSYLGASTFIAILSGTLIGSYLITIPAGISIIVAVLLILAGLGFLASCFLPALSPSSPTLHINKNIFASQKDVLFFIYRFRLPFSAKQKTPADVLWWLCLSISWFWLIGAVFLAQLPILVRNVLSAQATIANLFLLLFTLGITIGAALTKMLVQSRPKKNILHLVPLGNLGMGICTFLLYLSSRYLASVLPVAQEPLSLQSFLYHPASWGVMISLVGITFFAGIFIVPLYTQLIILAPPKKCGRVIAANNICNAFFMVSGSLFALLCGVFGLAAHQILFLVGGLLNLILIPLSKRKLQV